MRNNLKIAAFSIIHTLGSPNDFIVFLIKKYLKYMKLHVEGRFMWFYLIGLLGCLSQFFQTTKRKGWINHGIKGPESIADHMYRMALMALIAGDNSGVNRERSTACTLVLHNQLYVFMLYYINIASYLFFPLHYIYIVLPQKHNHCLIWLYLMGGPILSAYSSQLLRVAP